MYDLVRMMAPVANYRIRKQMPYLPSLMQHANEERFHCIHFVIPSHLSFVVNTYFPAIEATIYIFFFCNDKI